YDRFMKSLVDAQALVQERSDQGVLLVTHGGLIRAIVPYLCVNAAALQRVATPGNAGLIILEPYDRSRFICRAWNIIEHLQ
ncbi:MAG: histidine phosphatase family protein, partial [Chloroflexota bacterium]